MTPRDDGEERGVWSNKVEPGALFLGALLLWALLWVVGVGVWPL